MFNRLFKPTKAWNSRFDTYLSNVVRVGRSGAPTADEARKDFAATVRAASLWHG